MLSAFLIALREGVEAALVVGIILVYLSRTGRAQLARFVWSGVAVAGALSLALAIALERGVRHFDDHLDEPRCAAPAKTY